MYSEPSTHFSTSCTVTPLIPISASCLIPSPITASPEFSVLSSSHTVPFTFLIASGSIETLIDGALSVSSSKFFSYFVPGTTSSFSRLPGLESLSNNPAISPEPLLIPFGSDVPSA